MSGAISAHAPLPPIRLQLLGDWYVERDAQPIQLPRHKEKALFAYLALFPQPHAREKVAALFWGDSTDEAARRSLRVALTTLRQHLSPALFLANLETIQLNPAYPLWVDTREFERRVLAGEWTAAVELYRGDLLSDFYDDWALRKRDELHDRYIQCLLNLTRDWRAQSEYARAIETARRVLVSDRANETAHQHLMFCLVATGDRGAALAQYAECEQVLRQELGVEPSQETRALLEWIKQTPALLHSPAALPTNLPIPLTSFVGRQREVGELKRLLKQPPVEGVNRGERVRLLTLTGAGGSGKTRLAIQAGMELIDSFRDGVWWVDLAVVTDPGFVPQAVAKTLGVQEGANEGLVETLVTHLCDRQMLLILDNCEHLIAACGRLTERLLMACAGLCILTTSREGLGIGGEMQWQVPPLGVPRVQESSFADLMLQHEAVRLFVERGHSINPGFTLTDQNALTVARICQRLDGIPLAIELAAARVKVLSVEQIAQRLDDRFGLLTGGSRTALPRQQTLRALIDWSYDLLSEPERILFRRLAVFAGGWTLEAAEQVCSDVAAPRTERETAARSNSRPSILDLLTRLVYKSLVVATPYADGFRYDFLETIREYARQHLVDSGEAAALRERHVDYFCMLAESAEPWLISAERQTWLDRLTTESDNLRAALEWSQTAMRDGEARLRLAGALSWFWFFGNYPNEGQRWLESTPMRESTSARDRARVLLGKGLVGFAIGDFVGARTQLEASLELYREIGDRWRLAQVLTPLGFTLGQLSDYAHARPILEESVALARELLGVHSGSLPELPNMDRARTLRFLKQKERWWLAYSLNHLGDVVGQNDFARARTILEEGLKLARPLQDNWLIGNLLMHLSEMGLRQGDYASARLEREESLDLFRQLGAKREIAWALAGLGEVARCEGDYARAAQLYEESLPLWETLSNSSGTAWVLHNLGDVALARGQVARARELFVESLSQRLKMGNQEGMAEALDGLAGVAAIEREAVRAARLFGAADGLRARVNTFIRPYNRRSHDDHLALARSQLDAETCMRVWTEGYAMTAEQAVAYALE